MGEIGELFISLFFGVDQKSGKEATQQMQTLKDTFDKILGVFGISLNLEDMNEVIEDWYQVDKVLYNLNTDLESTEELTNYITDAANSCRMSYTAMANAVNDLTRAAHTSFSTAEEAADFLALADQAFQVSGATADEINAMNQAIVNTFTTGKLSAGDFQTILSGCPEILDYLAEATGHSKDEVLALGMNGNFTAKMLRSAFEQSADAIEEKYEQLNLTVSDALTMIQNEWGTFLTQLNEQTGVTADAANTLVDAFDAIMKVLGPVLEVFAAILDAVFQIVDAVADILGPALDGVGEQVMAFYDDVIKPFVDQITNALNFISALIEGDTEAAMDAVENLILGVVNGIISGVEWVINSFIHTINSFLDSISMLWTWTGLPAISHIDEVSLQRVTSLAEGGYVGADDPRLAIIGDNPTEGEIVAPESKIREAVEAGIDDFLQGFDMSFFEDALAATANLGTGQVEQTLGSQIVNNINQNVYIYNTFDGSKDYQQTTSEAMRQSTDDIGDELARAIAYSR